MKSYFSPVVAVSLLLLSSTAMAKISPMAFKGVTKHLKKGKEMYSPTLGEQALDFLIEDIRFQGHFTPAYDEKRNRVYSKDKSDDPFWNLTKTLFPSVNGVLGVDTQAAQNFASYVRDPKAVALLINYAYNVRKALETPVDIAPLQNSPAVAKPKTENWEELQAQLKELFSRINELKENTNPQTEGRIEGLEKQKKEIQSKIKALQKQRKSNKSAVQGKEKNVTHELSELKSKAFESLQNALRPTESSATQLESNTLKDLLSSIESSIMQELKGGDNFLYPKGTTEQVLLAFFDYKFDKQSDIWELMSHFDDELVDKQSLKIAQEGGVDLSSESDIRNLIQKTEPYEIDDLYELGNASLLSALIPYKEGVAFLSHGNARLYDRASNQLSERTFADCVETTVRHTLNLLFYNPNQRAFDTSRVQVPQLNDLSNNPTHQLITFFQKQSVDQTSSGDIAYRSDFNTMIADLNVGKNQNQQDIVYLRDGKNELDVGAFNFINVLSRVLNIPLEGNVDALPGMDAKIKWAESNLQKLLDQGGPGKTHRVELKYPTEYTGANGYKDIIGTLSITVFDMSGTALYSFDIKMKFMSARVTNLKQLQEPIKSDNLEELVLKHQNSLHKQTTEDSLWLSFPKILEEKLEQLPALYQLFSSALTDNAGLIQFVCHLSSLTESAPGFINTNSNALNHMLRNVLDGVSWTDPEIVGRINPYVFRLIEHKEFQETLFQSVKGVSFWNDIFVNELLPKFKQIEYLGLLDIQDLNLSAFPSLKESLITLDLKYSAIKTLKVPEGFKKIKEINLSDAKNLDTLEFTGKNDSMTSLNLSGSNVKQIVGLNNLRRLENLNLRQARSLKTLEFTGDNDSLTTLDFFMSGVKKITGLHHLKALKTLDLKHTKNLESLVFSQENSNLEKLDLTKSGVKKITGLHHLMGLKELNLGWTNNLEILEFGKENASIEELKLWGSDVPQITGLHNLRALKELDLSCFKGAQLTLPRDWKDNDSMKLTLPLSGVKIEWEE